MRLILLVIVLQIQICTSVVIFEIRGGENNNVKLNSTYLFGTVHVPHGLIWPYFSKEILEIFKNTTQFWFEHDFTDGNVSSRIYECSLDKMSIKIRSRLRAKTWAAFLNATKPADSDDRAFSSLNRIFPNRFLFLRFIRVEKMVRSK